MKTFPRYRLWLGFLVLTFTCVPSPAQTTSQDAGQGDDIQAKVQALEAELDKLRQTLAGDEAEVTSPAVPGPKAPDGAEAPDNPVVAVPVELTQKQQRICEDLGIDPERLKSLIAKPLFEFTEPEVDVYLKYLTTFEPELPGRIKHLARKNIGQPYEIYLLGEMPFECYDPQPIYCLTKSDCLVFAEHTYAMALSDSWPRFIRMLQRIRYADGRIGVATRNHYTEADWNPNNHWLVRDITPELARLRGVRFAQKIDRAKFLRNRYKLETGIPVEERTDVYLPFEYIDQAKGRLRDGDFVNIVRGIPPRPGKEETKDGHTGQMQETFGGSAWVGHTGMIVIADDGEVHLIHSARPEVREESLDDYIAASTENLAERDAAGKARLLGFKFLRLQNDPILNLQKIDGRDAPKVTLPDDGLLK